MMLGMALEVGVTNEDVVFHEAKAKVLALEVDGCVGHTQSSSYTAIIVVVIVIVVVVVVVIPSNGDTEVKFGRLPVLHGEPQR